MDVQNRRFTVLKGVSFEVELGFYLGIRTSTTADIPWLQIYLQTTL